jgi:hypothetical protein
MVPLETRMAMFTQDIKLRVNDFDQRGDINLGNRGDSAAPIGEKPL